MIDDRRIHYYSQPVTGDDEATSLAAYLCRHGRQAYKNGTDEVIVPMECPTSEDAAQQSAQVHNLIGCWGLFWEHSDSGVFELPIYQKD